MHFEVRKQEILEVIRSHGTISISELAKTFNISEITIRRDLTKLESVGLVRRIHGAVVDTPSSNQMELSFFQKCNLNLEEKIRIAQKASELVSISDTIMLDAGTTTLQVAKQIKNRMGIHVITNSIYILLELAESSGIEVSLTGGALRKISRSLIGPLAIHSVKDIHVETLFLGASGVSLDRGLTSPDMTEAQTKTAMMRAARTVILLADHTKFGKRTLGKFGELKDVHVLITDKKAPQDIIEPILRLGIEVIQV
jgi:DeoR/GlpR family transcriptional regulator of sugar metabolism